ncbi:LytTr DNA-binding domain protein [compost metagenome]
MNRLFMRIFYTKPFKFTPESQSLKMRLNRMKEEKFTFIKTDKKIVKLHFDSIAVIKGLGNYVQIITIENIKHTYYKSLKDLIDVLPNEFMRVHNSFIVNLTNIDSIEDNHIMAKGNKNNHWQDL